MRTHVAGWVLLLVIAFTVGGCARQRRLRECNAFIGKVNSALKEINRYTKTQGADTATIAGNMKKLSRLYQRLAGDIGQMHIRTPELKRGTDEYRSMALAAAAAAGRMADAFEKKDVGESRAAQHEFQAVVTQEHTLIARINHTCSRHRQ